MAFFILWDTMKDRELLFTGRPVNSNGRDHCEETEGIQMVFSQKGY